MTTDEKIDEVLKIVREQGTELRSLIRQESDKSEVRDQALLEMICEERKLSNDRFTQLSSGLSDAREEIGDLKTSLKAVDAKIDKLHESLTADINAFGEDLYETKRRVTRLEKKLLSS
jgi:septal ring factor EnvC (AmiA/AmiB activator)